MGTLLMQAGSGSSCSLLLADRTQVWTAHLTSFPHVKACRSRPVPCSAAEQTLCKICLYITECSKCLWAYAITPLERRPSRLLGMMPAAVQG